ncbi:sensor histidine kinase [Saccharothrix longispora]|uniref:histidine kinase n=1 Tax=Saccharothrix longispora TaxID=33920 RepID=A0ABU1PMQ0_9PSEU|nr:histidine kinase [Saccharothrix longispora]MDR6591942.1 signal transduction histidine kinase [Saccharothrix longispora]
MRSGQVGNGPVGNGVALAVLAAVGVLNGLDTDALPLWRQLLFIALAVASYLHGRHLPTRCGGAVLGSAAAVGVAVGVVAIPEGMGVLASLAVFVVLPRLVGLFRRQQAELITAGRERIAQLERAQELVAEQAGLRERARIATDMHDSLGHELALIALRAGALELTADTDRVRRSAAELRASAVHATDRLRHTLGVLREGATPVGTPDEPVEDLVGRAADAGLPVVLTRTGSPALPPLVDRAVHRVVQEALTNAARHAPGRPVSVRVDRCADEVLVTVSNPVSGPGGNGAVGNGAVGNGGTGLAGLAERVRVLGGGLVVRRDPDFTVAARLPFESAVEEDA